MSRVRAAPNSEPPAEEADEALLVRYRERDDIAAFETLVRRYERPLLRYLTHYLRNAALAEDVFQATFLRLHEKRDLFDAQRQVRPWLYRMATRLAIDALRKEGRQHAASLDDKRPEAGEEDGRLLDLLRSRTPSPVEQAEAEERAVWTRRSVDKLPDSQRVIVLLVYFQDLKLHEAAEILDLPLGTLKSRLHKALVSLNAAWKHNHVLESEPASPG